MKSLLDIPEDMQRFLLGIQGRDHLMKGIETFRVICIVTAEVVKPWPDRPTEGFFAFHTEFSPMADPSFEGGR